MQYEVENSSSSKKTKAHNESCASGNAINGVSPTNPNRDAYVGAAESEFGQAGEYLPGDHSLEP
jgi:hypothetical protein